MKKTSEDLQILHLCCLVGTLPMNAYKNSIQNITSNFSNGKNQLLFINYDIVNKAKKNKQLHFKDTPHSSNMPTQNNFFGILDSSDFAPKSNMPKKNGFFGILDLICPLLV